MRPCPGHAATGKTQSQQDLSFLVAHSPAGAGQSGTRLRQRGTLGLHAGLPSRDRLGRPTAALPSILRATWAALGGRRRCGSVQFFVIRQIGSMLTLFTLGGQQHSGFLPLDGLQTVATFGRTAMCSRRMISACRLTSADGAENRRMMRPMLSQAASVRPSGEKATATTGYDWRKHTRCSKAAASHSRIVPSDPPEAIQRPSGDQATASTASVWPRSFPTPWRVTTFRTESVRSEPPESNVLLFGENATEATSWLCQLS